MWPKMLKRPACPAFPRIGGGTPVEHASASAAGWMWPKMLKAFPVRMEKVPAPYQNEVRKLAHEGAVSKAKETGALAP